MNFVLMKCFSSFLLFCFFFKQRAADAQVSNNTAHAEVSNIPHAQVSNAPLSTSICPAGSFTCMNSNCITDADKLNNTVNDCGDNSDEGVPINVESCLSGNIKKKFKCTNGACISLDWYLDGDRDCNDRSDEYKIIGSRCSVSEGGCCPCSETVENSECIRVNPPHVKEKMTGICRCFSGWMQNVLGTVCTRRKMGDPCDVDPDCFSVMSNTICQNKICVCASGYYLQSDTCIRRKVGDSCTNSTDCSLAVINSDCTSNHICTCNSRYIATTDRTQCNIPTLDTFECSTPGDCTTHFNSISTCNESGICVCLAAFYADAAKMTCVKYELESRCDATSSCLAAMNNTLCLGRKCVCSTGYFPVNPRLCLPRTVGMSGCMTNADCSAVANSRCLSGNCSCLPGHLPTELGTICKLRTIGDACHSMDDCTLAVLKSECNGGWCKCVIGYKESFDAKTCNLLQFGDECQSSSTDQCQIAMNNSRCVNSKCVCREGFEPTTNRKQCKKSVVSNLRCTSDVDCSPLVENSICVPTLGSCNCARGYFLSVDETRCDLLQVGRLPCDSDVRCVKAMNSTTCVNGLCVCLPGFYPNVITQSCVNVSLGKTECMDQSICQLAVYNSDCLAGQCQCTAGYKALAGRSCVATQLGQSCQKDEHCTAFIEHSTCMNDTCMCANGFNSTDGVTCTQYSSELFCYARARCNGWCAGFIGLFIGMLLASAIAGAILLRKKFKNLSRSRRVVPLDVTSYAVNQRWQLDWNNRPPAHIPVMYKSECMKAPDELYGNLLQFNFDGLISHIGLQQPGKMPLPTIDVK